MKYNIKKYGPELKNEDYHAIHGISGSGLAEIYSTSVKHFLSKQPVETEAMKLGTIIHTAILEPEDFDRTYASGLDESSIPESALKGVTQMKSWLKDAGIKVSGGKKELIERINLADPLQLISEQIVEDFNQLLGDKEVIPFGRYQDIIDMRTSFMSYHENNELLADGALVENSVTVTGDDGITLKSRPDIITSNGVVVNYKTCVSANPNDFMRKALGLGYVLRAAFEYDMAKFLTETDVTGYAIVAQEKTAPFTVVRYVFGEAELQIGREMYQSALDQYIEYKSSGVAETYPEEVQFALPDYMYSDSLELT